MTHKYSMETDRMDKLATIFVLVLSVISNTAFANSDYEKGVSAYKEGNYKEAYGLFEKAVQKGNYEALDYQANMHWGGVGDQVLHDRRKSITLFKKILKSKNKAAISKVQNFINIYARTQTAVDGIAGKKTWDSLKELDQLFHENLDPKLVSADIERLLIEQDTKYRRMRGEPYQYSDEITHYSNLSWKPNTLCKNLPMVAYSNAYNRDYWSFSCFVYAGDHDISKKVEKEHNLILNSLGDILDSYNESYQIKHKKSISKNLITVKLPPAEPEAY